MTDEAHDPADRRSQNRAEAAGPRRVRAEELYQGEREVWIELDGARYRLRITRRNKLILQK